MRKRLTKIILAVMCMALCTGSTALAKGYEESVATVDIGDQLIGWGGFPEAAQEDELLSAVSKSDYAKAEAKIAAALDKLEKNIDLSACEIKISDIRLVVSDFINRNPRYFFVKNYFSYSYNWSGYVTTLTLDFTYSENEIKAMLKKYDAAVALAMEGMSKGWSDMEKALYINDYLAKNCEYDLNYQNYNAYNALVEEKAVCQGYAQAYMELAREAGLTCEVVTSIQLNHAWNLVRVDGKYYHVDTTWNDPTSDELGRARHYYFLKSTNFFKSQAGGHYAVDWCITNLLKEGTASSQIYDNEFWNNVGTAFERMGTKWYAVDSDGILTRYAYKNGKLHAEKQLLKQNSFYAKTASYAGKLYLSSGYAIYEINYSTGGYEQIYKHNSAIYGMRITKNGVVMIQDGYGSPKKVKTLSSEKKYKITYQLNGGKNHASNPTSFTSKSETIRLKAATRKGYTFAGWYSDKSLKKKVTTIAKGTKKNITLYAKWTANKYTIAFQKNNGTGTMKSLNCVYDKKVKLPKCSFKRKGYTFKGWNTQKNGKGKSYKAGQSVCNLTDAKGKKVTLYAIWKKK